MANFALNNTGPSPFANIGKAVTQPVTNVPYFQRTRGVIAGSIPVLPPALPSKLDSFTKSFLDNLPSALTINHG